MSSFLDILRSGRVLLMDGAMGTELIRAGLTPDDNAAAWNVTHPEQVRAVHQAYRDAGAEVLLSNTLMACDQSLFNALGSQAGDSVDWNTFWHSVKQRMTVGGTPYRLVAIGPVAGSATPREFDRLEYLWHCRFINIEFDALLFETCSSPRVRLAIKYLREKVGRFANPDHLILMSMTYQHTSGRIVSASGHTPQWFAQRAKQYGVAALGVNCGRDIGLDDILTIVRRYRDHTDLPIFARPNAGTPEKRDGQLVYPLTPQQFAERTPELLEAGVCMIGGCCGTTPHHIAALRPVVDAWNAKREARET